MKKLFGSNKSDDQNDYEDSDVSYTQLRENGKGVSSIGLKLIGINEDTLEPPKPSIRELSDDKAFNNVESSTSEKEIIEQTKVQNYNSDISNETPKEDLTKEEPIIDKPTPKAQKKEKRTSVFDTVLKKSKKSNRADSLQKENQAQPNDEESVKNALSPEDYDVLDEFNPNPNDTYDDTTIELKEHKSVKQKFKALIQKARDGELFNSLSLDSIKTALYGKRVQAKVAVPILIVGIALSLIISLSNSIENSNNRIKEFNSAAGAVCIENLAKYGQCNYEPLKEEYGKEVNRLVGLCFIREIDFNDDGKSELLIGYNNCGVYYNEIFGLDKKGEFVSLYNRPVCKVNDITHGDFIAIYRHNNKYYIAANEEPNEDEEKEKTEEEENSTVQNIELYSINKKGYKSKEVVQYDYMNGAFIKNGKVNLDSFEKIKLSCIKKGESERRVEAISKQLDKFESTTNTSFDNLAIHQDDEKNMYRHYYDLVQEYNARYGIAEVKQTKKFTKLGGLAVVKVVDFDGDGIEELMMIYNKEVNSSEVNKKGQNIAVSKDAYICEIYKWTGQKPIRIFRSDQVSSRDNNDKDQYYVIKKDGSQKYYCENLFTYNSKGKTTSCTSQIYELKDRTFIKKSSISKASTKNGTEYKVDGKKAKKHEFEYGVKDVALFLSESTSYDISIFDIGYVSRDTSNSADVEKQLQNTIKEIQKLNSQYVHE